MYLSSGKEKAAICASVADPDSYDPYVFGQSGSVCESFGSGSLNIKINLDSCCLRLLYGFLSLKTDVNLPSESNKQKKLFFVGISEVTNGKSRIRIC